MKIASFPNSHSLQWGYLTHTCHLRKKVNKKTQYLEGGQRVIWWRIHGIFSNTVLNGALKVFAHFSTLRKRGKKIFFFFIFKTFFTQRILLSNFNLWFLVVLYKINCYFTPSKLKMKGEKRGKNVLQKSTTTIPFFVWESSVLLLRVCIQSLMKWWW